MKTPPALRRLLLPLALLAAVTVHAWDHEGHRMVNQLALAALPADFPAFVREPANAERIAFLANVPDRWRNVDPWLRQTGGSWIDHFLDIEQLADAGLDARTVPSFRNDFILQFAAGRTTHLDKFPAIDPTKDADHTREWPGFAPWAITEWYQRLRSAFSYLKAFEETGGTPEEIANAKADVVYVMGVMGHYVGDCAQPLHTTIHHAGWVGPNPNNYTVWTGFHSWIDGGFIAKAGINLAAVAPGVVPAQPIPQVAQPDGRDPMFVAAMNYIIEQNKLVEPLYALEKKGVFKAEVATTSTEAQDFIKARLLTGGNMLASIWVTAWKNTVPDTYLRGQLAKRMAPAAPATPPKPTP